MLTLSLTSSALVVQPAVALEARQQQPVTEDAKVPRDVPTPRVDPAEPLPTPEPPAPIPWEAPEASVETVELVDGTVKARGVAESLVTVSANDPKAVGAELDVEVFGQELAAELGVTGFVFALDDPSGTMAAG